uniref:Large ribosomal subunit protein uL10m n=1 Tax=Anguilla anguilla TaxID=7936 RepID=A0A0E9TE18_ANGAN
MLQLKHRLRKHGIAVRFLPNQVMRAFLEDSQYSNMEPLFIGPTVLLVSKEPKVKRDAAGPEGCAPDGAHGSLH